MIELIQLQESYESRLKCVASDKEQVELLLEYALKLLGIDFDLADKYAAMVYPLAISLRDKKSKAASLKIRADCNFRKGNYSLAILKASEAASSYAALGDMKNQIECFNLAGASYHGFDEYEKAQEYHFKSLELCKKVNSLQYEGDIKNRIAVIYTHIKEYNKALGYFLSAKEIYTHLDYKHGLGSVCNNMGRNYLCQNQFEEALHSFEKALAFFKQGADLRHISIALNNIGVAYMELNNISSAFPYLIESLHLREQTGDKRGVAECYQNLGEIYLMQKEYDKAFEFLKYSRVIGEELQIKSLLIIIHKSLFLLYTAKEEYEIANEHEELMKNFEKEVNDEAREKRIKNMEVIGSYKNG